MIVCYSNDNNKIVKVISGINQIPPFSDEISSVQVDSKNLLIKKGDEVHVNEEENYVKIGYCKIPLHEHDGTIITEQNCDKQIYLEELTNETY